MSFADGARRTWCHAAWLAVILLLAQACGGDKSRGTGATGSTQVTVAFQSARAAQLPQDCTGVLRVSGQGFEPFEVIIPQSGRVEVPVIPGPARTFAVILTCRAAGGAQTFTGSQTVDVFDGRPLTLSIAVDINRPPSVQVSCTERGSTAFCRCSATDPDRDPLSFAWDSDGQLSHRSGPTTTVTFVGTAKVTCTVSDGRATASATVAVGGDVRLTVTLTGAGGTMSSRPAGIACTSPGTCAATFPVGTVVTLTRSGPAGAGWGGACAGVPVSTPTCTLTLSGNTSVSYDFTVPTVTLTVTLTGAGGTMSSNPSGITCTSPGTCTAIFPLGTVVTLTRGVRGQLLGTGWGGACAGVPVTSATCTLTLTGDTFVSYDFTVRTVTLTVTLTHFSSGGTMSSSPAGIACTSPATCSATFPTGTVVTLTRSGIAGTGWGGACAGVPVNAPTCTLTLNANTFVSYGFF